MNHRFCVFLSVAVGFMLLVANYQPVLAQDFYKDKTIRFIVGQAAGGGYDTYTRVIARHISKHIPGNPIAVVENMTGAGSLVAANYVYGNAKPDGLTVANWNSAFVLNQALGDPNVQFDARKFGWIGAPSKGIPVCVVMGFAGVKTFEDILKSGKTLKMGGTAPGSHSVDLPLMLNKMLGTKFSVVSGYQGTAQVRLAMQRREVDGDCTNWESVIATRRDLLDAKGDDRLIPFLIHTRLDDPEVRNLPLFTDVSEGRDQCRNLQSLHGADGIPTAIDHNSGNAKGKTGNPAPRFQDDLGGPRVPSTGKQIQTRHHLCFGRGN